VNDGDALDDEGEGCDNTPRTAIMTDRLVQRLSAHRTVALQIEIARHSQVALVHGITQKTLQG